MERNMSMETIYAATEFLLPFEWASHTFMKNALLAVLFITPLFGLLGTMVVSNRLAFFADSLGHSAFTGIAAGSLASVVFGDSFAPSPRASLVVFSVLFALFIMFIKNRGKASTDTVISVFSSAAVALGLMIMSRGGSFNKFSAFLIGDLLSVTSADIAALAAVSLLTVFLWGIMFNPLLLSSLSPSLAKSRGINTVLYECIFAALLAVIVAVSIEWVGVLIINSLLVLPAAGAANIATGVRQYHLFSVLIALFSGLTGLIAAYYLGMAAGAVIALTAAMVYFVTLAAAKS